MMNRVKSPSEIEAMRESGRMLATVLKLMEKETRSGITPKQLAALAEKELKNLGGEAPFKGYHGYPDVICISVNSQVQHSIPTNTALKDGDIVNYDFGVRYRGMITDAGITVGVGDISGGARRLLDGCERALEAAVNTVRNDVPVGDISSAIETVLKHHRLGIVRDLVGHGVGDELHEEPNIPNYGKPGRGPVLKSHMTVAIEPIATLGSEQIVLDPDGWTIWTADGSLAAQFEHTLLVTDDGAEILTQL